MKDNKAFKGKSPYTIYHQKWLSICPNVVKPLLERKLAKMSQKVWKIQK